MKRRLFTILSALSLLLFVAVVVLWVRSYWRYDSISRSRAAHMLSFRSEGGYLHWSSARYHADYDLFSWDWQCETHPAYLPYERGEDPTDWERLAGVYRRRRVEAGFVSEWDVGSPTGTLPSHLRFRHWSCCGKLHADAVAPRTPAAPPAATTSGRRRGGARNAGSSPPLRRRRRRCGRMIDDQDEGEEVSDEQRKLDYGTEPERRSFLTVIGDWLPLILAVVFIMFIVYALGGFTGTK